MAKVLLKTNNLIRDFGANGEARVLHGIDLEIEQGDFITMIGASGSGKSTLLNILGALDRPTQGEVIVEGTDLSKLSDDELAYFRNKTMGFIFQSHFLLPQFSILENVLIPYQIYTGRVTTEIRNRALDLLDQVGLSHRINSRANAISGGEQQRGAIARALINKPRVILADEPTGNLDSTNTEKVFQLLKDINQESKTTFIMVTHDSNLASQSNRLVEMKDGRILTDKRIGTSLG
ncbi:MAG: ABC transporter ATP-binding protein [Desulfitobacterium sp.]